MSATAIADVTRGTVLAQVEIAAPPERVFAALTEPAQLAAWWGSPETYRSHDWEVDLRPGGRWSAKTTSPQGPNAVGGEYLVVEPPRLLVYTWQPSWQPGLHSTVRCELEPVGTGTRVRVTHTGFEGKPAACEEHEFGWITVLGWVQAHLERAG